MYHPKACREPGQRQRMEKMAKAERKGTRSGNDGTRRQLLLLGFSILRSGENNSAVTLENGSTNV